MLIGIINQKTKEEIRGICKIEETKIGGNKTQTVICEGYAARAIDKLIYKCSECNQETTMVKRMFMRANKLENMTCKKCAGKKTSLEKYGVESPNQSAAVKQKQHAVHSDRTDYVDGNEYKPNKTSSPEELAKLRSKNAKKHWQNGIYDNMHNIWSEKTKKRFTDIEWKKNWLKTINDSSVVRKKSNAAKRNWQDKKYRKKMSKIGIRISKFQKNVFEAMSDGWIMEYPIDYTTFTVDMCNPETMEVIECYGDYWHCNPEKYRPDYYHQRVKKTAQEIWDYDKERIELLEDMGYTVKIIWENDWKHNL